MTVTSEKLKLSSMLYGVEAESNDRLDALAASRGVPDRVGKLVRFIVGQYV